MSPRKLTEDDKQEILQLYRNSEATTSTLAKSYEVSSSTISRFLKNQLSSTEYEDLIQQKRLARTPRGEKANSKKEETKEKTTKTKAKKTRTRKKSVRKTEAVVEPVVADDLENTETTTAEETAVAELAESENDKPNVASDSDSEAAQAASKRRRRRRSSASKETEQERSLLNVTQMQNELEATEDIDPEVEVEPEVLEPATIEEEKPAKLVIDKKVSKSNGPILKGDKPSRMAESNDLLAQPLRVDLEDDEDDEDDDEVDLITLKEMLGEDLEDINDEDDDDWDDDNEEEEAYSQRDSRFEDLEILPLSQATFPRTCYLVIDRSAELIVKPLADFGDLGEIPQEEIRQKTLPVFDNHNIAKRFSHRRERVIKVPDGRMLQKTSRHLQDKGITRLLIDGQIYSLSS